MRIKDSLKDIYLKTRKSILIPFLFIRKPKQLKGNEIKTILFLRHDRVGDMVLSTAVFKALKRKYPAARLTILASERNHEIIQNNPYVDEILIYKGIGWFVKEICKRNFDLTIDPFNTYKLKQAFMAYISGAKYRIGFEEAGREIFFNIKGPGLSPVKHLVEHMLELVSYLGCDVDNCYPEIFLTKEEISWATENLAANGINTNELIIAIHPGAFYPSQRWPAERFGEIAKRILENRVEILVFGNKGEESLLKTVQDITGGKIKIFYRLQLRQFMALLSHCNLLICNNSGPLHIASALRLPTVSVMGPTVTPLWLPWGNNHIVIRKGLSCSPCNKAICSDHECMKSITVDEVMEAVRSQIAWIKLQ